MLLRCYRPLQPYAVSRSGPAWARHEYKSADCHFLAPDLPLISRGRPDPRANGRSVQRSSPHLPPAMSCSNQPEEASSSVAKEETLMPRKRKIKDGNCMKCKTDRGVFSRMGFVYCRCALWLGLLQPNVLLMNVGTPAHASFPSCTPA